ncbi:MAG TPA: ATP-binding cassette domain-containing protein, partial [Paracoccaceae bacterium]|nr:ATP-binding cassette domain-containing protein [Paracoccaceae bacterium]
EDQQRHKLNRLIKSEARWAVEGISARRKRNMGRVRRLQDLRTERSDQIKRVGTAKMELESGPKSGKLVVEVKDIAKSFGERQIVRDFSLRIQRGERVALVGPNGAGKTTLLKILTGEIAPDSGTVKLGTNLIPAVFDQNRAQLDTSVSLWDNLTQDKELGVSGKNDQIMVRGRPKHVVGYLKEFLFNENQARSPVSALSGGEKARLLLARIMAKESNLLILDEPTNDLDVETLDLLQELIDDYDGTVILVSHDRDFLDRVATTTIAMEGDGKATIYAGGYSDYRAQRGGGEQPSTAAEKKSPRKSAASRPVAQKKSALTGKQEKRLKDLPAVLDRLGAEIAKLEEFLSDPQLFAKEPLKFKKATEALTERQDALAAAEEEWLELEELAQS